MNSLRKIAALLLFATIAFNSHANTNDYHKLTAQEKADLARYLGWVWGDGRPDNSGNGILYKGGNPNYDATVTRLAKIRFDGKTNPFRFPVSGNLKHAPNVWDYWENSLPGGNPGDPEILREAIRHPNFLAGIIEGEGQGRHSSPNNNFYIADQSYAPSHPDKMYGIANFGPERMIQLFLFLEETYGFSNPAMSIGNNAIYNYDTQRCEVIKKIRKVYRERKAQNKRGNLQPAFTVKVYIKPPNFDEIRSYGYFSKSRDDYRTPAPDSDLSIISSNPAVPAKNTEVTGTMTFFNNSGAGTRLLHGSGYYLNSDLDIVRQNNKNDLNWELIDLNNGYYRIESLDRSISKNTLQAPMFDAAIKTVGEQYTWFLTQWEKVPVADTSNQYYLKNRFHETYLRVSYSTLNHGVKGSAARWTLEKLGSCAN